MTNAFVLAVTIIVRTYNYAQVPPDQLEAARSTTEGIFQSAGIVLQWIDCRTSSSVDRPSSIVGVGLAFTPAFGGLNPGPRVESSANGESTMDDRRSCTEPLREGQEFVLRLMASPSAASTGATALGTSLIDGKSRTGVLMTVDPHQVSAIAQSAVTDSAILLGRAVAHEIGHLLLGHPNHSRSGLMRAFWSQRELRGTRAADWHFSSLEATQMRQGILARTRAAN
jgi:hypothetical protein